MHPLWGAFAVSWAAQIAGLVLHHFGDDPAGHPLFSSPLNTLMISVPLYTAWLLLLAAAWGALWKIIPPLRPAVSATGLAVAGGLVLLGQIDFGMQRFRGERLSLTHFRTYSPGGVLNSDVFGPVLKHPSYPLVTLGVVAVAWLAIAGFLIRTRRTQLVNVRPMTWRGIGLVFAGAVACYVPIKTAAYYHQRDMAQPPYVLLVRAVIFPTELMTPAKEARDRAELRQFLDPAGTSRWMADEFPLMRTVKVAAAGAAENSTGPIDPPDIVIFVVESLRGRDVGWGLNPRPPGLSVTPHLDALAARSVTFPRYIANGDPSPRGFIAINAGVWEHRWGFIIANFPNLTSDSLPGRLRASGYRTMALWGGNPSFDNQLVWARRWFDDLDFQLPGNDLFYFQTRPDRLVMDNFVSLVRAHDARAPGRPFFAYVASNGTHTPFTPEDDEPLSEGLGAQDRYDRCLRHIDAQIARVVAFLETRPRANNTVVIVIGDHADNTNEPIDERLRGLPTDANVWTAALVHGPERLVGRPRREEFPASHVDLLPTILAWLGDTRPWVGFGQNLFAPIPAERRSAVAVNSRGYRLDRAGYTLLVDSTDSRNFFAYASFPSGPPALVPLAQTPFAADEPQRLAERMVYWSYLVEQNRVWEAPHLATTK